MEWLAQNWVWLLFAAGIFLLMRRGGMGCGMGGHRRHRENAGADPAASAGPVDPVSGERVNQAQTGVQQGTSPNSGGHHPHHHHHGC